MLMCVGAGCVGGEKCGDVCLLVERPYCACADVGSVGVVRCCSRVCAVGLGMGAGVSPTGLEIRGVEVLMG